MNSLPRLFVMFFCFLFVVKGGGNYQGVCVLLLCERFDWSSKNITVGEKYPSNICMSGRMLFSPAEHCVLTTVLVQL